MLDEINIISKSFPSTSTTNVSLFLYRCRLLPPRSITMAGVSVFANISQAPEDPILGVILNQIADPLCFCFYSPRFLVYFFSRFVDEYLSDVNIGFLVVSL